MPDAVVIGAGPNGLVAANLLADRGWDVIVAEASSTPGGAVRSEELIEPGFVNDVFSGFYPLAAVSPPLAALHLEDFGLEWVRAPLAVAHPASDGTCPAISMDLDETVDLIGGDDGDAWRQLFSKWTGLSRALIGAILGPFPPVRASVRLAAAIPPREWVRTARFLSLPARRLGEEWFTGDPARRLVAGSALHADLSPEQPVSGMFGWLLASLGQQVGWPLPRGGAGQLAAALVNRLEQHKGRVLCDAPVTNVIVRNGRAQAVRLADGTEIEAGRAVLADVDAPRLFLDLVGDGHLPAGFTHDLKTSFQWDHGTVKVDWNLTGPIPWTSEPARRAGTIHLADSLDVMTLGSAHLATGAVPDAPFVVVGQPSLADPTRQPAGTHTAWGYTHVPFGAVTHHVADCIETAVEALAPGFRDLIRGRHVMGPADLAARNANLAGGAVNGGSAQLHQQLIFRPVSGLGRPETPVSGLFLASASAHPGGGVHGACGANAARAAVWADRRRRMVRGLLKA